MQIRNIQALRTTNKLTQNPSVGSLYSIETIMLMVNYALRKQMMIINDKLKDIDRKMSLYHRGDISSTDESETETEYESEI